MSDAQQRQTSPARQAKPAREAAQSKQVPLRLDAVAADLDVVKPNGESRAKDLGRIMNAAGFGGGGNPDGTFTVDEAEAVIRALEIAKRNGTLYDAPTMMLGFRQVPRYTASGSDNAKALVDTMAATALNSQAGTKGVYVCTAGQPCNKVQATSEELNSLIDPSIPVSPAMNPSRAFLMRTDTAAVMGYIAAMNNPQIVTKDKTPAQYLAEKTAAAKGADVVRGNRGDMRGCLSQSEPTFDLAACAKVGAQAAIYNIAQTGEPFVETNPMPLIRLPDTVPAYKNR